MKKKRQIPVAFFSAQNDFGKKWVKVIRTELDGTLIATRLDEAGDETQYALTPKGRKNGKTFWLKMPISYWILQEGVPACLELNGLGLKPAGISDAQFRRWSVSIAMIELFKLLKLDKLDWAIYLTLILMLANGAAMAFFYFRLDDIGTRVEDIQTQVRMLTAMRGNVMVGP